VEDNVFVPLVMSMETGKKGITVVFRIVRGHCEGAKVFFLQHFVFLDN
jgi:hypothetical protein